MRFKMLFQKLSWAFLGSTLAQWPLRPPNNFRAGPFWSSWSDEYGCSNTASNPFGIDAESGNQNFCRSRGANRFAKPEAFRIRLCVLPDVENFASYTYGDATTVNQFYRSDAAPG